MRVLGQTRWSRAQPRPECSDRVICGKQASLIRGFFTKHLGWLGNHRFLALPSEAMVYVCDQIEPPRHSGQQVVADYFYMPELAGSARRGSPREEVDVAAGFASRRPPRGQGGRARQDRP